MKDFILTEFLPVSTFVFGLALGITLIPTSPSIYTVSAGWLMGIIGLIWLFKANK